MIAPLKDIQQSKPGHGAMRPVYVEKCNYCGQQLDGTNTGVYLVNAQRKEQLRPLSPEEQLGQFYVC